MPTGWSGCPKAVSWACALQWTHRAPLGFPVPLPEQKMPDGFLQIGEAGCLLWFWSAETGAGQPGGPEHLRGR